VVYNTRKFVHNETRISDLSLVEINGDNHRSGEITDTIEDGGQVKLFLHCVQTGMCAGIT
jgi:hypothetical protein